MDTSRKQAIDVRQTVLQCYPKLSEFVSCVQSGDCLYARQQPQVPLSVLLIVPARKMRFVLLTAMSAFLECKLGMHCNL